MSARLSNELLQSVEGVTKPKYVRGTSVATIVHLGIGAFHRAHQALYTERLNNSTDTLWRIIGCSLRSAEVKRQLEPQDNLYTVLERGQTVSAQIVGCVESVLVGPENPSEIIQAIADSSTHIVSLTVTEKGYCHHPANGDLNVQHPDIQHDLSNLENPRTAVGYIVAGLQRRFEEGTAPITVLSCDNLPHNGRVAKNVVTQFAQSVDNNLALWIQQQVSFPSTMVDRIVPATTADDITECESLYHYQDLGLVIAEPFSQWVIENDFCAARPKWEEAGALLVDDVAPFETMKLRLLNGSHSLLAYAGYLAGCETVFQTMQSNALKKLCQRFMTQAATTFTTPEGFDVEQYQMQLIERFSNPSLKHKTLQIAMDGSQKVPQRWLNSVRELLKQGADLSVFAFALAAWIRFTRGKNEQDIHYSVSDPHAETFLKLFEDHHADSTEYVRAFFSQQAIFGSDLVIQENLVDATAFYLSEIESHGINRVLTKLAAGGVQH